MDDIQVLLYIVIGIFYFISRAMKKKPVPPPKPTPHRHESGEQGMPQRPLTFEELLKEFTQAPEEVVEERPTYQPTALPEPVVRNHEEPYVPSYKFADEEATRIYQESQRMAATTAQLAKVKQDEDALRFKEYRSSAKRAQTNTFADEIREMLKDSDGAKKAVVLAEILNRKY